MLKYYIRQTTDSNTSTLQPTTTLYITYYLQILSNIQQHFTKYTMKKDA